MARTWQNHANKAQKLETLVLKAKRLSEQLLSGSHPSLFKGRGMLFDEVRKYQAGDDVRAIHWTVTAKLREPHIKLYKEEKNLTVWLLVDVSGSGVFGTRKQTKIDTIIELCAVLVFAAQKSNCSVGAIFFSDHVEKVITAQNSNSQCLRILHHLVTLDVRGKQTRITTALDYILNSTRKGSLVVLLSDFMNNSYEANLRLLARKHELLGIRIYDKSEVTFPPSTYMQIVDAETSETAVVNTSSKYFQQGYSAWYQEKTAYFHNAFALAGSGKLDVATDEEYVKILRHYFQSK